MKIGEYTKTPPINFLKNTAIILTKGQIDLNFTLQYIRYRYDYAMFGIEQFKRANMTVNKLRLITEINAALLNNMEVFTIIPVSYIHVYDVSEDTHKSYDNYGLSDITLGVRYMLKDETFNLPSITFNISGTIPIGSTPYQNVPYNELALSSGHYSISAGVGFAKSIDPVIIFGGLNAGYIFPVKKNDVKYKPIWGLKAISGSDLPLITHLL